MLYNVIYPLISFAIVSIASLLMTRFCIDSFGYEGLGIISNSNAVIQSLFFVGGAFVTVYARAYTKTTIEKEKAHIYSELYRFLLILFFLSVMMSFLSGILSYFNLMKIGVYYSYVFLACGVTILSQTYIIFPFASNKVYVASLLDTLRSLLRIVICVVLASTIYFDVNSNAIAMLLSACIVFAFSRYIYRRRHPLLTVGFSFNSRVKESLWVCLNQAGSYAFSFADIILVSSFLGYAASGEYTLLLQIPILAKSACLVLIGSFASYAVYVSKTTGFKLERKIYPVFRVLSLLFSFVFFVFISFSEQFYKIWLGYSLSVEHAEFLEIIVALVSLNIISNIASPFVTAWGIYSAPAKLTCVFALCSFSILLCIYFLGVGFSLRLIFCVIYISLFLKNLIQLYLLSRHAGLKFIRMTTNLFIYPIFFSFLYKIMCYFNFSDIYVYVSAITVMSGFLLYHIDDIKGVISFKHLDVKD
ncbi:hypothetical protein O1C50_002891 [Vibrio cholerae]|nr:hypothetical protein [Vibrio cholerae]